MKAFAYITAEKAPLYRAIMRVFMESKHRFVMYMRPDEILLAVRACGLDREQADIDTAVEQLCAWGNLATRPDTSDVRSVEDFYKARYIIQLTDQGEAAERALHVFQNTSHREGELQSTALVEIRQLLRELKILSMDAPANTGLIQRNLFALQRCREDLTSRAQSFMASVQRKIDLKLSQADQFAASIERLVEYMERFVGQLAIASEDIAASIRDIESQRLEPILCAAAERGLADALESTPENLARDVEEWRTEWNRLRSWFISSPGQVSNAESLRRRIRAAMPAMLSVLTNIRDRQAGRIDRCNEFRVLARRFAQAGSDAEAHRLWRSAFGLAPARHLIINDATLDDHEARDVAAGVSWLDAPPLQISARLRASGTFSRTGRLSRIVDRTAEKKKLAAAARNEAMRILKAQARFASGGRMRLSDLEQLEAGEFELFLDLLGSVDLEPTGDGRVAVIQTPDGVFSGPDYWISIESNSLEETAL
jgi:uncharacterized protein (TIGR02677 family)